MCDLEIFFDRGGVRGLGGSPVLGLVRWVGDDLEGEVY